MVRLLQAGRLVSTTGDVYLVGGAPCGDLIQLAATCLATGGVVSHRSAAHLHGLVDLAPSRSEVTVGSTHGGREGLLLHRSRDLVPRDILRIEGIRTANATRTLIDLGGVVTSTTLETALERALHARLTTFDRLVRRFFEVARPGRTGVGPLRSLLVDRDPLLAPAESDLETYLCGSAATDRRLRRGNEHFEITLGGAVFHLDVSYPDLRIFIEGDGFGVHTTRHAFERDRDRQDLLVLDGWMPLRFTWRLLCHNPQHVAKHVLDARDRRLRGVW